MSALPNKGAQLVLIRHAPIVDSGVLCGQTDVSARIDPVAIAPIADAVAAIQTVITSPALRCRQTAKALWPDRSDAPQDARLWEQNFGQHEGLPYTSLPDLGPMTNAQLAEYAAPDGESFDDLCVRTRPALNDWAQKAYDLQSAVALVVHAGVIRSALGSVLDHPSQGLSFEIDPLSITRLRVGEGGVFSIISTNARPL
ncbi:MAG: histidine phosphatase family protein [Paracoccaceae bacterium]